MRRFAPLLRTVAMSLLFLPLTAVEGQEAAEEPLASYRDKNRVLLVFAPTAQDPAYVEQGKLWQGEKAGFGERQLVVVPVLADGRKAAGDTPAALEKRYGIDARAFAVVLLGKDGHDAYRAAKPLKADILYATIDAMPMRRAEMKQQRQPTPAPTPAPQRPDLNHDE